jgi:hypothetical protein
MKDDKKAKRPPATEFAVGTGQSTHEVPPGRYSIYFVDREGNLVARQRIGEPVEFGPGLDAQSAWDKLGEMFTPPNAEES